MHMIGCDWLMGHNMCDRQTELQMAMLELLSQLKILIIFVQCKHVYKTGYKKYCSTVHDEECRIR